MSSMRGSRNSTLRGKKGLPLDPIPQALDPIPLDTLLSIND